LGERGIPGKLASWKSSERERVLSKRELHKFLGAFLIKGAGDSCHRGFSRKGGLRPSEKQVLMGDVGGFLTN